MMRPRPQRSQREEQAAKAAFCGVAMAGTKAIRQVTIKVFNVGGKGFNTYRYRAPNGKCFLQSAIDDLLSNTADKIEELLPEEDYSLVGVGPGCFNFVWKGKKAEVVHDPS